MKTANPSTCAQRTVPFVGRWVTVPKGLIILVGFIGGTIIVAILLIDVWSCTAWAEVLLRQRQQPVWLMLLASLPQRDRLCLQP